jgi:hypothetical protein
MTGSGTIYGIDRFSNPVQAVSRRSLYLYQSDRYQSILPNRPEPGWMAGSQLGRDKILVNQVIY